jgi:hypothetical protein
MLTELEYLLEGSFIIWIKHSTTEGKFSKDDFIGIGVTGEAQSMWTPVIPSGASWAQLPSQKGRWLKTKPETVSDTLTMPGLI